MDQKTIKQLLEDIFEIKKGLAQVVTKDDAKSFATRNDLKNVKDEMRDVRSEIKNVKDELLAKLNELDKMQMAIFKTVELTKEDRIVVAKLTKRVDRLEEKVFA
jgi:uncharacterized protein YhaN